MNILVIDDILEQREYAKKALAGHTVVTAKGWKDGSEAIKKGGWNVVMTDLSMPAEPDGQGYGKKYVGEPTPYGFALTLLALQRGVPKIAIVSNGSADGNHHSHPIYWASDSFHGIVIPGRLWAFTGYNCPYMKIDGGENPYRIKDWGKILEEITKG